MVGAPDHPRPRGEHDGNFWVPSQSRRSPPPTRGTPARILNREAIWPFTPAHAGNICPAVAFSIPKDVHPRPRGEHANI